VAWSTRTQLQKLHLRHSHFHTHSFVNEAPRPTCRGLFQMSFRSNATTLLGRRYSTARCHASQKIKYTSSLETKAFIASCSTKLRILAMNQYRRVLFLDGDVIPLVNPTSLWAVGSRPYCDTHDTHGKFVVVVPWNPRMVDSLCSHRAGAPQQINTIIQTREEHARITIKRVQIMKRDNRKWQALWCCPRMGHVIDPSTGDPGWVINSDAGGS
jgi:hypothetical protein